ncbi:EPM2A-interacting protein 1 [Octopus sinensis]|uniref:EPM2A-interacting protein 1 n=1 Tax=Octopus sinensis TaxID=2607531 RepID=A0A6P7S6Q4_9MOLL|nr:EPM2A-interacting protein 1 [Octopus sinensis]
MERPRKRRIGEENRKFQEKWTKEYFVIPQNDKVLCLICHKVGACLKEYNIKRHYNSHHKSYNMLVGDERNMKLELLLKDIADQTFVFQTAQNEVSVYASYVLAYELVRSAKPLSEGEFLKQCMMKIVDVVIPDKKQLLQDIDMSNVTMFRRIIDVAEDLQKQLQTHSQSFVAYSISLDICNDISETPQLLVFIRGVLENFDIHEELLSVENLSEKATGIDIFHATCRALNANNMNWELLVGVTTDSAPAMIAAKSGAVALLSQKMKQKYDMDLIHYHRVIPQETLISNVLLMDNVISVVVKCVNLLRSEVHEHNLFKSFLEDCKAEFGDVYFSTDRWVSNYSCLKRFFSLTNEIKEFLYRKDHELVNIMDSDWMCDLAFLVDISSVLNELNTQLLGNGKFATTLFEHTKETGKKLQILQKQLKDKNLTNFATCKLLLDDGFKVYKDGCVVLDKSCTILETFSSEKYTQILQRAIGFLDLQEHSQALDIFENPFTVEPETAPTTFQLELRDLQEDSKFNYPFCEKSLINFYEELSAKQYPKLRHHAQQMTSLFGSTYICEKTFTMMNLNNNSSLFKTKFTETYHHPYLRVLTSNYCPRMEHILEKKSSSIISGDYVYFS